MSLRVEGGSGTQPVPVRRLESGELEVLLSPGFVEGIAAGDVIRVTDSRSGDFEIVRRGGNLAIKVFHLSTVAPVLEWLMPRVTPLHARLDGQIERAAVLTIPVRAGFAPVEAVMADGVAHFPGLEWYFANVYGPDDQPLNWWLTSDAV